MNSSLSNDSRFYYRYERHDSSLCVCSCGYENVKCGYLWGPGSRAYYILHHQLSGRGTVVIQGKPFDIRPGDTFVTRPNQEELLRSADNGVFEYLWVGFSGAEAGMLLHSLGLTEASPLVSTGLDDTLRELHNNIYQACGASLRDSVKMTAYLYLLFSHLMGRHAQSSPEEGGGCLHKALSYINDHYCGRCTVSEVCAAIGFSRSCLYRTFMEHMGISPVQYINEMRNARAFYYLKYTQMSISEIAFSVGYSDPLYFSRRFKTYSGTSPLAFRRAQTPAES